MNVLRTTFAHVQYLFVVFLGTLYRLVPARRAYQIGSALTRAVYPLFRARRKIAIDNLLRAHITDDPQEADHIARMAFGHLAGHVCEAFKTGEVIGPENWREHISFDGPEESWKLLLDSPDVPIMILTGHLGAWEVAASVISFTRPMIAVARKMNNPFVERFMKANHFRGQITIVSKTQGFSSGVIRLWMEQKAAMTILMDQHAGAKHGICVPFMGRPASTHTSPARLHLKTGAPILVGGFIRDGLFHYRMVTGTPIRYAPTTNKAKDMETLLTTINSRLEAIVRRYPEQYLWAHKRWR